MTFGQIFNSDFLFNSTPPPESRLYLPLIIFFGVLILLSIGSRFLKGDLKRFSTGYYFNFLATGILGYIYLFGRYEGLAWIGSRLLLLLIFIIFTIWLLLDAFLLFLQLPAYVEEKDRESRYSKYLPKSKNK
jgi:hypothetical protein